MYARGNGGLAQYIHYIYIHTHTGLSSIIKVQVIKIQVYIEGYEDNYME